MKVALLPLFTLSTLSLAAGCSSPPPADDTMSSNTGTTSGMNMNTGGSGSSTGGTGNVVGNGGDAVGGSVSTAGTQGNGGSDALPGTLPFGHPDANTEYPTYEGFTLWLVEEFNEPLDLDTDPIWTWSDGALDEGQVRFQKEGITFADGKMILTVTPAAQSPATPEACSHAESKEPFTMPLISGEFRTRHNMFRYGRYEARYKAPSVQDGNATIDGNYVSTLFVFRTPKGQNWREIDIEVTGDGANTVTTNLITANNVPTWNGSIQEVNPFSIDGMNTRTEFHDFAFEWLPDRITWYVDGQVVRERTANDGGLPIPELSAKFMMNLWIFGPTAGFGGPDIENNQYPMHSEYEWVRFYKYDGDDTYPCMAMDATCLAPDDMDLSSNNPCDGLDPSPACMATCN